MQLRHLREQRAATRVSLAPTREECASSASGCSISVHCASSSASALFSSWPAFEMARLMFVPPLILVCRNAK